jgi:hypothetical protein
MKNYGYAPDWHFMVPPWQQPNRRRNSRRDYECPDPFEQIMRAKAFISQWEEDLKKNKKEDKKPPSGWEQLQMFIAQLSVMVVVGYPLGKLFIMLVEKSY